MIQHLVRNTKRYYIKSTARACGITTPIYGDLAEVINYKGEARKE